MNGDVTHGNTLDITAISVIKSNESFSASTTQTYNRQLQMHKSGGYATKKEIKIQKELLGTFYLDNIYTFIPKGIVTFTLPYAISGTYSVSISGDIDNNYFLTQSITLENSNTVSITLNPARYYGKDTTYNHMHIYAMSKTS